VAANKRTDRIFIPAKLDDNPYLDREEYRLSLLNLDDVTRAQLLDGLWITDPAGKPFKREFWADGRNRYHVNDSAIANKVVARWISWDTAMRDSDTSAYTACTVAELAPDYQLLIRQVWRDKLEFPDLVTAIRQFAELYNTDGKLKAIILEDKISGTSAYQTLLRIAPRWLQEKLIAFMPTTDKLARAQQISVWCKRGCIQFPFAGEEASWLYEFESELFSFPDSVYKDQVDSFVQIVLYLENLIADGFHARESGQV
jgi:predicted phage terminase large subunit-like protein